MLKELNEAHKENLRQQLQTCCGSAAWVQQMVASFPVSTEKELLDHAERIWFSLDEKDWKEAFEHHPKIGDMDSLRKKFSGDQWAAGEQAAVERSSEDVLQQLADYNKEYEEKFGYIFIVCATGKSAEEMLALLMQRLNNDPGEEIEIAAAEQNKITQLRLQKLLNA